ncbi:MAG: IPT/TIG domain-containing protein [Planctomycetes bacterium]|nr:IPT/TIG domain-containing protein [Planctomycetota bacterium]
MIRTVLAVGAMILAPAALASPGGAQVAQSGSYQLLDWGFDGGGGGACSTGFAAHLAVAAPSGAVQSSANFSIAIGPLQTADPKPTNAPVVFGVSPDCGPSLGGTQIQISGLNFDKFGAAPSVTVTVGGAAAGGVNVQSDTVLLCTTPPGAAGRQPIAVSSTFGSGSLVGAFQYTNDLVPYGVGSPGCSGPHLMGGNLCPRINTPGFEVTCTQAPPNALGLGIISNSPDLSGSDSLGVGVLFHVDFFTSTELYGTNFVSDGMGLGRTPVPVPNVPSLVGAVYYIQAYWAWTGICALPPLDLSSSQGLQFTIAP